VLGNERSPESSEQPRLPGEEAVGCRRLRSQAVREGIASWIEM
jgi:hypothetical protein